LLALLLSLFNRVPFIVNLKGFYPADALDTSSIFLRWITSNVSTIILSHADHISYNSGFLKAQFTEYFTTRGKRNIVEKPSSLIHQSIDEEYFEAYPSSVSPVRRVLYVGNLNFSGKYRGVKLLLDVWKSREAEDDVVLTIAGSGRYLKHVQEQAEEDRIQKLEILGHISKLDLIQLYSSSCLFIYPSYQDALPSVVIEAQAMGLPAVVTNTSGAQEIVDDGVTGVVCDPEMDALGEAIKRLLIDEQLREKMSYEARRRVRETFSWSAAASRFDDILNKLGKME